MELETTNLNDDGFYERYGNLDRNPDSRQVVSLKLKNLPPETTGEHIRSKSGARHVIEANSEIDNIKNCCVGTGSFKCRLGEGERQEQIVQRFKNEGFEVEKPRETAHR